jgi:hypothetical protein
MESQWDQRVTLAGQEKTETASHKSAEQLETALDEIRRSPKNTGTVELIACRPEIGTRRELATAELTSEDGLLGDSWKFRSRANADMQVRS